MNINVERGIWKLIASGYRSLLGGVHSAHSARPTLLPVAENSRPIDKPEAIARNPASESGLSAEPGVRATSPSVRVITLLPGRGLVQGFSVSVHFGTAAKPDAVGDGTAFVCSEGKCFDALMWKDRSTIDFNGPIRWDFSDSDGRRLQETPSIPSRGCVLTLTYPLTLSSDL
ncbi:unnamed protein product [Gadus morhua 'NCC']